MYININVYRKNKSNRIKSDQFKGKHRYANRKGKNVRINEIGYIIEKKRKKLENRIAQDHVAYLHAGPSSDPNRFRRLTVRNPP